VARTLHFAGLLAFVVFVIGHTAMVFWHGAGQELAKIVLGDPAASPTTAILVALAGLALVALVHVAGTRFSDADPRAAQRLLGIPVDAFQEALARSLRSRQHYPRSAVSDYHWVNGRPPAGSAYKDLAAHGFAGWRLEVGGMVERPLTLTLADLERMPVHAQVVKHNCIQGWTATAEWTGVRVAELLRRAGPRPGARYLVVWGFTDYGEDPYYETLDVRLADDPQCLLAWEMNGRPLPIEHGAPLRLRVENQLGFKMVKWVTRLELVADYCGIGQGQGGWREDRMYYSRVVAI
jgi:DMSO/TMAO reductase YedYZ molybdopterin-dependent catalytic subunit